MIVRPALGILIALLQLDSSGGCEPPWLSERSVFELVGAEDGRRARPPGVGSPEVWRVRRADDSPTCGVGLRAVSLDPSVLRITCQDEGDGCDSAVDGGVAALGSCSLTIAVAAPRRGHTHLVIIDARGDEIDSWDVGTW